MWHRLSVHVRKQEAGLNQTAVIRPLTNTPDPHSCEPSTRDRGTDYHLPQEACGATKPLYNLMEDDDEEDSRRPLWTPPCSEEGAESHLDKPPLYLSPDHENRMEEPPRVEAAADAQSLDGEPMSSTPPLPPRPPPSPPYDKEGSEEDEELDLLHGYIYDTKNRGEDEEEEEREDGDSQTTAWHKVTPEEPLVLSPPSPFRDSVCSEESLSSSPLTELMLANHPSSLLYTSNILGDFAHSSSTL